MGTTRWHRQGPYGVLTLDNPPQNLIPHPLFVDPDLLGQWLQQEDLKGVILTGGGRHFSGGADPEALDQACRNPEELGAALVKGQALLDQLERAPVPVVAAVRGGCLGAGLEIALTAPFRIAAPTAVFGFPESGLGVIPGLGGAARITRMLPRARALTLLLSGEPMGAAEALELGLIHRVAEDSPPVTAASALLDELTAHLDPPVIRGVLEALHLSRETDRTKALAGTAAIFCRLALNMKETP